MNTLTIATLETRHFTFEGVGGDEDEARTALLTVLRAHTVQMGDRVEDDWYAEHLDDVRIRRITRGFGYRDGNTL